MRLERGGAADGLAIARLSAAEIEGAVIAQVRGLLRQPEVVLGAWRAAQASAPDMTEDEVLSRTRFLWTPICPRRDRNDDVQHERVRSF